MQAPSDGEVDFRRYQLPASSPTDDAEHVLEWSSSQNCFHIQPLARAIDSGSNAFHENRRSDYVPIGMGSAASVGALADELRPILREREAARGKEGTKESIPLGEFHDGCERFSVWLDIGGEHALGPRLCWRSMQGSGVRPLNSVYLASLLDIAVLPKPLHLSDPPADIPGDEKAKFVATALAALRRPFKGDFKIVWVPDDGLPF